MPLILPGNVASATAPTTYTVANSCRFSHGGESYMSKTLGAPTDVDKFTVSFWTKIGSLITEDAHFMLLEDSSNSTGLNKESANHALNFFRYAGGYNGRLKTTAIFRDPSAWYHIVCVYDSANGTAGNRMRMYVNGTEITDFAIDTNPSSGLNSHNADGNTFYVGAYEAGSGEYDGYIAEFVFIDGLALTPSSFGEFDEDSPSIWKPIDVSGLTFGNNGFYLDFEASGNLGNDVNGGTDLGETNIAAVNQCQDSPTNNFATWNPLFPDGAVRTQGNTVGANVAGDSFGKYGCGYCSIGMPSSTGIYYCEIKLISETAADESLIGLAGDASALDVGLTQTEGGVGWFGIRSDNGTTFYNAGTATSKHAGWEAGDIMGLVFDSDNKKLTFSKNGGWWDATDSWTGSSPDYTTHYIDCSGGSYDEFFVYTAISAGNSQTATWAANFGNGSFDGTAISSAGTNVSGQVGLFEYSMPSSSKVLSTKGLNS